MKDLLDLQDKQDLTRAPHPFPINSATTATPTSAETAAAPAMQAPGALARIRGCLPGLARHGLIVVGFCTLIAVMLWCCGAVAV